MTNNELIDELSEQLGWTEERVSQVLSETVDILNHTLANNSEVVISTLGTFQTQKHKEHITIDQQTKKRLLVPPRILVHFKPCSNLISKVFK